MELDLKTNNFAGATSRVERRLKEEPTPTILLLAARTYIAAKDSPAAERVLRQAIELDALRFPPYELLGRCISRRGSSMRRASNSKRSPGQAKPVSALTMTGMILMAQGQTELAKKRFEEVLAIDPRAVIAANNLAWMLAESGDNLDTALKYAQVATAQAPDQPELMDTLGWVYYKKNLPELAIPLFENCVKKAPGNASYHHHLGVAYLKAGKFDQARASLQRALANNPDPVTGQRSNGRWLRSPA